MHDQWPIASSATCIRCHAALLPVGVGIDKRIYWCAAPHLGGLFCRNEAMGHHQLDLRPDAVRRMLS